MSSQPLSPAEPEQRLLAAIVFTDVAGFSRRMQTAESATLKLLERDFATMRAFCAMHAGRVVKSTGDGLLIFFSSAVQAVEWALKTQRHFADQAATLEAESVLRHRIGVHLGDVIIAAGDVMGDGVNIAQRVQTHAPAGGICISQMVHGVVKNKLKLDVVQLEPRQLKNISEPVRMYHVLLDPPIQRGQPAALPRDNTAVAAKPPPARWKPWAVGGVALLAVGAAVVALFKAYLEHERGRAEDRRLRETIGAVVPSDPPVEPAPTEPPPSAPDGGSKVSAAPAPPANAGRPKEQFDFAKLTASRSPGEPTTAEEKKILQAANECLAPLEAWTAAALEQYTSDRPLHIVPFRNVGFHSSTLFTENHKIHFAVGGATKQQDWNDLTADRRGAIIASLLRSAPVAPREMVRAAEAFAYVHRLPEMAEMLRRDHPAR